MSKLPCICGQSINLSAFPNPYGFRVIPETLVEPIGEKLLELHNSETEDLWFVRRAMSHLGHNTTPGIMHIYECKECGRIAVFARESDQFPTIWYKPEKFETPDKGKSLNEIATKLINGKSAIKTE